MGHRLTTALIFLNAMGLFACLILIAANCNQTPDVAIHFTRAIQFSTNVYRWSCTSAGRLGNRRS